MKLPSILITLLLFVIFPLQAQKQKALKYREVMDLELNGPEIKFFQELQRFQGQKPDENANVYYQLGKICHKWMRTYDPIKAVEDVQYFTRHTKIYLGLCQARLTKNEIGESSNYYSSVQPLAGENTVTLEAVQQDIQNRLTDVTLFEQKHQALLNYYQTSLEKYDHCIDLFMKINQKNSNLKHLYLTVDPDFQAQLKELEMAYDAALSNFKAYQTLVQDYPMGDYNPDIHIEEIQTYRLQGLTGSDFAKDTVRFWDFGKWVKEFNQTFDGEIAELRKEVQAVGNQLSNEISQVAQTSNFQPSWDTYSIPNKTAFHIHKWDYQSDLLQLFRYQEAKLAYLKLTKTSLNNPTSAYPFQQKALFYQKLVQEYDQLNTTYQAIAGQFSQTGFDRHAAYLASKFGSLEGIKAYLQEENAHNQRIFQAAIGNFQSYTINQLKAETNQLKEAFTWKMARKVKTISTHQNRQLVDSLIFQTKPDTLFDERFYTYDHIKTANNEQYITGFYKPKAKYSVPFIAKVAKQDSLHQIAWLKLLDRKHDQPAIGFRVAATNTGCIVAVTSFTDTLQNFVMELDSLGKIVREDSIPSNQIPRRMQYDVLNKELLLTYKGNHIQESIDQREPAAILLVDDQFQVQWNYSFAVQGNLIDILRSNNTFYAFGNFTGIQTTNQPWKTSQSGAYALALPLNGKGQKTIIYSSKAPLSLVKVVKNTSNTFSLLGFRQTLAPSQTLLQSSNGFYYSIVTNDGNMLYETK